MPNVLKINVQTTDRYVTSLSLYGVSHLWTSQTTIVLKNQFSLKRVGIFAERGGKIGKSSRVFDQK